MKANQFFLFFTFICLNIIFGKAIFAQDFADKEYYLVDSLVLKELTKSDQQLIDSCLNVYHLTKDDTSRINALNFIVEESQGNNVWPKYNRWIYSFISDKLDTHPPTKIKNKLLKDLASSLNNKGYFNQSQGQMDKALKHYFQALGIRKKIRDKKGIALSLNNLGYFFTDQGKIEEALKYYLQSLVIQKEIGNKKGVATGLNNIGYIYKTQGQIKKALEYYHQSLKILEEIGNKKGIAVCLNNIGAIYNDQGQAEKALEYYQQSLRIQEEIGNKKGIAFCLNNIGAIYNKQGLIEKALEYYQHSLKIQEEIKNKRGIAFCLNNIGTIFSTQGKIEKSLVYYNQSLKIREEIIDKEGIAFCLNNLGNIYHKIGKLNLAKKYYSKNLTLVQEIGSPELIEKSTKALAKIAQQQGKYKEAFNMYKLYIQMRDSINNKETYKATIQQQSKYEYDKKTLSDSIANTEAKKVYLAILSAEKVKSEKRALEIIIQKKQKYILFFGLGLLALFGSFMYNRVQITKKQKNVIEQQKYSVESQKKQIVDQHKLLEETHKEINDSIKYAERLQLAILPPKEAIITNLGDSFVLFQPKNVVSGDFYWMQVVEDTTLLAVADCTGHGVPGALVSVVCSNALNRSVKEFGLVQPKNILEKTRELVIETFARSGKDIKDGMDIALFAKTGNQITFAGANNPLWIVRKIEHLTKEQKETRSTVIENDLALIEYKANKQSVGLYEGMKPFEQTEVITYPDDTLYIFTDGFADQFGGELGKKFKYKPFKKVLLKVNKLEMKRQRDNIKETFENWRGNLEQVDDICIIGIKM